MNDAHRLNNNTVNDLQFLNVPASKNTMTYRNRKLYPPRHEQFLFLHYPIIRFNHLYTTKYNNCELKDGSEDGRRILNLE